MPKIVRRRARKSKPVRRYKRKPVARRSKTGTPNYAIVTEGAENTLSLNTQGEYAFNYTTSLSQFQRSQEIAHAYKYYRAKKVELIFVPYANVAMLNAVNNQRLPQLYFTVDRVANQWIQPTENEMIERGIRPQLFKKKMTFSWKPSLLQTVQMECNQPVDGTGLPLGIDAINAINSVPLFNKWLPTQQSYGYGPQRPNQQTGTTMVQPSSNPYALRYYGASFVINQEGGTAEQGVGDLITRVTWEFKGPRALSTNVPLPQITVSQETSTMNNTVVANTQPTEYCPPA